MPLHLIKLCVGVDSPEDLREHIRLRQQLARQNAIEARIIHTTRMVPKQSTELLDGGSLYWVMKGNVQARQLIIDIEEFKDEEGIKRCHLVLDPEVIQTQFQPRRAFQGWRYLKEEDAPEDLARELAGGELDPQMRAELIELCLI